MSSGLVEHGFVELLGRTSYSLLEGVCRPEALMEACSARAMSAVAICDRNGLYGLPRAHQTGKDVGVRLIVGAELDLEEAGRPVGSLALLAKGDVGYTSLCRLLTEAHAHHEKGTAGISAQRIAESASGLLAIAPLTPAVIAHHEGWLGTLHEGFGEDLSVAVYRHAEPGDRTRTEAARAIAERFGVAAIASARAFYADPAQRPLADVVTCIREKTTLDAAGTLLAANAERYLRSPAQMRALFSDSPAWVDRTVELAARCTFGMGDIRYRFPSEFSCQPGETPDQALRRTVEAGCRLRYPEGEPAKVRASIEKELALVREMEVAPYFLSVREVVEMARAKGILCQGRGSAANSAICYVLGVTAVDPATHELLFERFLSKERAEPPDIDIDFEHERREEVIQEIYRTWGRERAAMVSEVICYRGRSALREVGKVFGLPPEQLDRLSGLVLHLDPEGWSDARLRELGLRPEDTRLRQVLALAREISGTPRHLSIHVGGFVISADPLERVCAVEPARMKDRTVVPWDKDDIDTLGFFKLDVLGLGMLTAIRKSLELVHQREQPTSRENQVPFDPIEALANIPKERPEVYEAICRADTVGVFQIESRAQMSMLPRLKPTTFYDLVIEVAIVRPGPIQGGMVHPYLRRRTGKEKAESPHPSLDPILKRTLGVPLFQEQVMQIAMVGAGYTPGEADQLRRDMAAWRRNGKLARHRGKLLAGFAKNGISEAFAEKLYKQVHGFAEYGFPESHAASFALLVYASAYLKVHHPAAFACALLNSQPMGFYSTSSIVQDVQRPRKDRAGVEVHAPDVSFSDWDSTLVGEVAQIRLGLREIKGFPEASARAIEAARNERAFESVHDLAQRASLQQRDLDALAEAGALGSLVRERRQAMWQARAPRAPGLFEKVPLEAARTVKLSPASAYEQLLLDYTRLRLSVSDHPMRHLRSQLKAKKVLTSEEVRRMPDGSRAVVAGLVIGRQRPETASGVTFVTLEDETGIANLVVWRDVFDAHWRVACHATSMIVHGKVQREGEVVHVMVERFERLDLPSFEGVRSRDFH